MFVRMMLERRGLWEPQVEVRRRPRRVRARRQRQPLLVRGRAADPDRAGGSFEGGIDLVAPTRVRRRDIPFLLSYAVRGKGAVDRRGVQIRHDLDRIEVRCDRPLPLQADGEDLGDVDSAVFEAVRDAVSVLV
jgi:hypothetical protein